MAGMPGLHEIPSDPEVFAAMQDPEVMVAFQDVAQNPGNTSKYQSNPKLGPPVCQKYLGRDWKYAAGQQQSC
ncbi:hypothetical protein P7K49_016632, partial [Saguinus oedipus]